jgi:hypothetical protein
VLLPPFFRQIFVHKCGNAAHLVVHQCAVPVTAFSESYFPDSWMFWFLNHRIASMKWLSVKWIVPFARLLNFNDRKVRVDPPVPWLSHGVIG